MRISLLKKIFSKMVVKKNASFIPDYCHKNFLIIFFLLFSGSVYPTQETKLMRASLKADLIAMITLIDAGSDVNAVADREQPIGGSPVLRFAIDSHSLAAVRLLLRSGANPNDFTSHAPLCSPSRNVRNLSLLLYAIRTKAPLNIIEELLNYGADINGKVKIYHDFTALMVAAIVGYTQAAQLLLTRGANKFAIDHYTYKTALDYAIENGNDAIIQILK